MSDLEKFLARWSRRKLEPADKKSAEGAPPGEPAAQGEPTPEFDVSKLPPLNSIDAGSDIRSFLQAGVPAALRDAALRRAWSADPSIRDFVGLNENFWDAAGVDAAAGFGELDPGVDVKKLLSQVLGDSGAEPQAAANVTSSTEGSAPVEAKATKESAASELEMPTDKPVLQRNENGASHQGDEPSREVAAAKPKRHGGAMPQ